MRVAIGADHAGYDLKQHLIGTLKEDGHDVVDLGTHSPDRVDYPPICAAVGRAVVDRRRRPRHRARRQRPGRADRRQQGARRARRAVQRPVHRATLSREHNDANVLSMGGRIVAYGLADEILRLWLSTPYEGGRHDARLAQIRDIEDEESA